MDIEKSEHDPYVLYSNRCQSKRTCPKILKICELSKFDMDFQKTNMRVRSEKVDFCLRDFLRQSHLKCQDVLYLRYSISNGD
jgi:hypothetical protein